MSKNKKYIAAIIITALLVVFFGAILIGAYEETHKPCEDCTKLTKKLRESNRSYGEIGKELYTIEIWADGSARVTTLQGYIQEPEDGVLIITNRAVSYEDGTIELY